MFGNKHTSRQSRRSLNGWWLLIVAIGIGQLFLLGRMPYASSMDEAETATISSTDVQGPEEDSDAESKPIPFMGEAISDPEQRTQVQDLTEADSFLTDYDFTTDSFLTDNTPADRPMWQAGGELALKLVLVIGLIYLVLAGLRWLQRRESRSTSNSAAIRILESTGLAPGQTLHLVVVGEKTLLIGATDQRLSILAELADIATSFSDETSELDESLTGVGPLAGPALDWEITMENLRTGVRRIREATGG
jgi:flagellar biogenesis protein FliO